MNENNENTEQIDISSLKDTKPQKKSHKKAWIAFFVVVGACAAAYGGERYYFSTRSALHTEISGIDVGGMTKAEAAKAIGTISDQFRLTLTAGDRSATATAKDLGIDLDADDLAAKAVATGKSANPFDVLFGKHKIDLSDMYDSTAVESYVNENFPDLIKEPTDAALTYDSDANTYTVTPGASGQAINIDDIKEKIDAMLNSPSEESVTLTTKEAKPAISDTSAQQTADQMNTVIAQQIQILDNGKVIWTMDPWDIASFAVFTANADSGSYDVSYDEDKIKDFINTTIADQVPDKPVKEIDIVDDNDKVLQVVSAGSNGQIPDNVDEVTEQMIDAFNNSKGAEINLTTKDGAGGIDKRVAEGGKWIEYNRTTYTVTLHQGDSVYWSTDQTADGKASTPTITGIFSVLSKVYVTSMPNPPSPVPLDNIHYVTYWESTGYAFHEGWWLTNAKIHTGISHGCVNMWLQDAKTVYDFATIGMPVWVHD